MKKIFAAAALLLAMTACGGSQKKALPLEGTTWKLAKMEAIPAKAVDAEADFFTRNSAPRIRSCRAVPTATVSSASTS